MTSAERPLRAVVVGECLIELIRSGPDRASLRPAGDTFNTASMLARASRALGRPAEVEFRTGLGDDPLSDLIADAIGAHGLVDAAVRVPGSACGLYLLDEVTGAMWYWRSDSAAHALFQSEEWVPAGDHDLVVLSLITLQQMSERARERAAVWLETVRASGGTVAFSANHRPAGWPSREVAGTIARRFAGLADLVFSSVADCRALLGAADATAALNRLTEIGVDEAIVTAGTDGASIAAGGTRLHVPAVVPPGTVDATGAGDAFAGVYLAWRTAGRSPGEAAHAASGVASRTVTFAGALPAPGSPEWTAMDELLGSVAGGGGPGA